VDLGHQRIVVAVDSFPFLPVGVAIIFRQFETLLFQHAHKLRLGFGCMRRSMSVKLHRLGEG